MRRLVLGGSQQEEISGHRFRIFPLMLFAMFAFNTFCASLSLLCHSTAKGRGQWGRWSKAGGFPPCGQGERSQRSTGRARRRMDVVLLKHPAVEVPSFRGFLCDLCPSC